MSPQQSNAPVDYVILQGKQVPYRIERIPVLDLYLDPENPRIEYLLGHNFGGKTPPQDHIKDALWDKDTVKALAQSIYANGGVREHIIVQHKDGKNVVREGNCRTTAAAYLSKTYPGDNRFATVPAHVFESELTDEDVAVLIADVHVAKKISWDAYTQAKQIHELNRVYGKPYEWLTNHLRMSKSKVAEYLAAYDAMNSFLQVHSDPANVKRFSLFHEMVRKKTLKQLWDQDEDGFRAKYFDWVIKGRIHDPRHVRDLEAILADPDAAATLDREGHDAAARVLVNKDPSLGSDVFYAIKRATEAVKSVPMSDINDLKNGDVQKLMMLKNLHRALEDLSMLAGVKL